MFYQLLFILRDVYNKILLFFSFLNFKKTNVDIVCVYSDRYTNVSDYFGNVLTDKIIYCKIDNCSNSKIVERVYTLCNRYMPKKLFVLFDDIDIIDEYHPHGKIHSISHEDMRHRGEIEGIQHYSNHPFYHINFFLRFVNIFLLLKFFCLYNTIHMFWFFPSDVIEMINKKKPYELFLNNSIITQIKINNTNNNNIAEKFIQEYEKYTHLSNLY